MRARHLAGAAFVSQLTRFLFTYQLRLYHYENCDSYSEGEAESTFLDYVLWKNTKGLLQWTFNHISPSTALQRFQGRLSIQEDQNFFDIDLIFDIFLTLILYYKGNPLLHFLPIKNNGAKSNLISTSYSNVASKRRTRILLTTFLVKCNQVPGYSKCLWIWILILLHFLISLDVEQQQKPGLARSVLDAAYADSGLALDFYTGFDANWNEPAWPVQGFDVLWSLYKQTRWTTQAFKNRGFRPLQVSNILIHFRGGWTLKPIFRYCFLRICYVSNIPFGGPDLAKIMNTCMHILQTIFLLSLLHIKNSSVLVTGHVLL